MAIAIEIISIINNEVICFGLLAEEEVIRISEQAKKLNLSNLQYIDYVGETIFNPDQINAIHSEINTLLIYPELRESLDLIQVAINNIENKDWYLRFSGE